jgi:hypothetical protein
MRSAFPLLCILALAATPVAGAPAYSVNFWNGGADLGGYTSGTPIVEARSYGLAPSNGTGTFTAVAHVGPGYVNSLGRVDCTWDGASSGGFSGRVDAKTYADDLIISGPPAPAFINATLNLHVRVNFSRSGGFPDNNSHTGYLELGVNTPYSGTVSDLTSGNHSTAGTGVFSGVTSPSVDMIVPIPGNYPVNTPFSLQIALYVGGAAYGNGDYSPGRVETDAGGAYDPAGTGVSLGMVAGQIMTLPGGYNFSIPSWGIYNNTYVGPVGVADPSPQAGLALALAGANPTSGDTRLALDLPRDGNVRVKVYDLAGRVVRTLFDGSQHAGRHGIVWDGRDGAGSAAAVGIYFVRADALGRSLALRVARVR